MELVLISKEELVKTLRAILNENIQQPVLQTEVLIDKTEAAKILKVSLSSIDNYRRKGVLKSYRVGNHIRFRKSEVVKAATSVPASF